MSRTTFSLAVVAFLLTGSMPAWAVDRNDTMAEWKRASDGERQAVLDEVEASLHKTYRFSRAGLLDCLNAAASRQAHDAMVIDDMAQACVEMLDKADPAGGPEI